MEKQTHKAMLEFPEVRMAVSKIGRADIAFGPEEPNESDPIVSLHERSTWKTAQTQSQLTDAIRRKLAEIPGISVLMSQPIQERVDELISGIRTECAIKLFGPDLDVLHDKAEEIATADAGHSGRQRHQSGTNRRSTVSHDRYRPAEDRPLWH